MTDPNTHSSFPPSRLDRVLKCPGSYALEAEAPKYANKQGGYADEGHNAHQLAEWALTDGTFDTRAYIGKVKEFTVDEEMCSHVQIYVDAIKARHDKYKKMKSVKDVTVLVEQRIDTSPILGVPKQSGTADALMIVEFKNGTAMLFVEDLKYGANVGVDAKDNAQLMTYGAGALLSHGKGYRIGQIGLVIHQPRINHVSEHIVTPAELRAFGKKAKAGVSAAIDQQRLLFREGIGALELNVGKKQCQFCKGKKLCTAFNKSALKKEWDALYQAKVGNDNKPAAKPATEKKKLPGRKK